MTPRPATAVPPIETVRVPAAEGAVLAATLVRPADGRPTWPAVLIRTPYGRQALLPEARGWAAHGFGCVVVDVRGRGDSTGRFRPYAHEAADGAAVLDVLRGVAGYEGGIVLAGASYGAHCAVATAITDDPGGDVRGVIAAVPALGLGETAREPGGAARLACRLGWWGEYGPGDGPAPATALAHLPVLDALPGHPPGWDGLWDAPVEDPWLWAGVETARVPLLAVGGTADPFAAHTAGLARRWGGPSQLLLGPWGHDLDARDPGGVLAGRRIGSVYAAWARAAVAGRPRGHDGLVALGTTGRWARVAPSPGRSVETEVSGDGAFTADPDRPMRSRPPGAPAVPASPAAGPRDRALARTGPLPGGALAGPVTVRLVADSAAPDADWVVRIGLRGSDLVTAVHRHRGPAAGGRQDLVVTTPPVGAELVDGDRLSVEVGGHHWPAHARNPHTGEDPVRAHALRPDRRRLRALRLELPYSADVLPAAALPEEITA